MNFWSPMASIPDHGEWLYSWQQSNFQGLRALHQPSPWIGDYGSFSLMPTLGSQSLNESDPYTHDKEVCWPYFYGVALSDRECGVTATERCGHLFFRFLGSGARFVNFNPRRDLEKGGVFINGVTGKNEKVTADPPWVEIGHDGRSFEGYVTNNAGGAPPGFRCYLIVRFSETFATSGCFAGGQSGTWASFTSDYVEARVGISFISAEQARANLDQEIPDQAFTTTLAASQKAWADHLEVIQVETQDERAKATFFTNLYRASLFPRKFYEFVDGKAHHYNPFVASNNVYSGYMYTDNGFWDTHRTVHPLLNLIRPDISVEFLSALSNITQEGRRGSRPHWLPQWMSPGHRNSMYGDHVAAVITDAVVKGVAIDTDARENLWQALVQDATVKPPISAMGRDRVREYNSLGYLPVTDVCSPQQGHYTSKTLGYGFDDFCMMQLAGALGKDPKPYRDRASQTWRNVFDATDGFMKGRSRSGFVPTDNFNPEAWGGPFAEGSSWHFTFTVRQDVQGLIEAMGGRAAFVAKLDAVFSTVPQAGPGLDGCCSQIHEITEMLDLNEGDLHFGQYAHNNQPVHHYIYEYDHALEPWKAQMWVRKVCRQLYSPGFDAHGSADGSGYPGDEDNGEMAAWFVWSAMGLYPFLPGEPSYLFGSPLFDRVTIALPNGKSFVIEAVNNAPDACYIQSVALNGRPYTKTHIPHDIVAAGGTLTFTMGTQSNEEYGSSPEDAPYSMTSVVAE